MLCQCVQAGAERAFSDTGARLRCPSSSIGDIKSPHAVGVWWGLFRLTGISARRISGRSRKRSLGCRRNSRRPHQLARQTLRILCECRCERVRRLSMPRPTPYPDHYPALRKLKALEHAYQLCGDCVTGCNYGSKNTLHFNYLPDPRNFGAAKYTKVCVGYLEREDGRWLVHLPGVRNGPGGLR